MRDEVLGAILGDIYIKHGSSVSASLFNWYAHELSFSPISENGLTKLVAKLKDQDLSSDLYVGYWLVKNKVNTLEDIVGTPQLPTKVYIDLTGEEKTAKVSNLKALVFLKKELAMSVGSNKATWSKVFSKAKKAGIPYETSKGYIDLLEQQEKLTESYPEPVKNSLETTTATRRAITDQLGILNTTKRAVQTSSTNLNKIKRELTDLTVFHDELVEAAKKPITIKPISFPKDVAKHSDKNTNKNTSLVVICSDWHIGASFNIQGSKYNVKIATNLINKYTERINDYIKLYNPEKVYIENLGDTIEGVQMRSNQAYSIELTLGEQIVKAQELQAALVYSLALAHPNILFEYTGILGNHDRFAPNKKDSLPYDGVALVIAKGVELATKELNNVSVKPPKTEYRHVVSPYGNDFGLVHGDHDKLETTNALADLSQYLGLPLKGIAGGHLHHSLIREDNGWTVMTGSLVGPTDFSDMLKHWANRSQNIILFDSDGQITPNIIQL